MSLSEARSSGESSHGRRVPLGTEAVDKSRHSIDGLNSILDEFEELWQKNSLHTRSHSDVLPISELDTHALDRRVFSAPQNYTYKLHSSSDYFETANEEDVPFVNSSVMSSDENLVLASSQPTSDPRKMSWSDHTEEGEVSRHMPRLRDHRVSLHSHRASLHGGLTDLEDHTSIRTPSKVPKDPPPAVPLVTPLSNRVKKTVVLGNEETITPQRRKPSGPRPVPGPASAPNQQPPPEIAMADVPEPPRRSSKRTTRRRNFRQASIENLLATKPDYTIDEIKLPPVERQLMNRFVDTLSKITASDLKLAAE